MATYQQHVFDAKSAAIVGFHTAYEPTLCRNLQDIKKAYGPSFTGGDFCTAKAEVFGTDGVIAWTEYFLYERSSWLVFSFSHDSRAEAIADARTNIKDLFEKTLQRLISEGRQRVASYEAKAVINKVKQQSKPRKIGRRRRAIYEASGGKCHYCETTFHIDGKWHIEHKMPRALGGDNAPGNLVAACVPCNMAKRDKTDLEFLALRATDTAV